jgi:hypothetical protein
MLAVAGVRILHNGAYRAGVPAGLVKRVDVYGLGDNDAINVRGVTIPMLLNGGAGSDRFLLALGSPAQLPGFSAGDRVEFANPAAVSKTLVMNGSVWALEAGGGVRLNGKATSWGNTADIAFDAQKRLVLLDRNGVLTRSEGAYGGGDFETMAARTVRWQISPSGEVVALQSNGQVRTDGYVTAQFDTARMAVDGQRNLYALSHATRSVWQWTASGFVEVSGRDISQLAADRLGSLYVLSLTSHSVWQRSGSIWLEVSGRDISQLAADGQGNVFALSFASHSVQQRSGSTWFEVSGRDISQMAVDGQGTLYALSFVSRSVWQWTGSRFVEVSGRDISQLAVDGAGTVYLRGIANQLWSASPTRWTFIDPDVTSLTTRPDGSLEIQSTWRAASLPVMDANRHGVLNRRTDVLFAPGNWAPDGYKASHVYQAESGIAAFASALASVAASGRSFSNRIQFLSNNRYNVYLYEVGWQQVYFDGTVYKEDLIPPTEAVQLNGVTVTRLTSYWPLLLARAYLQYQALVDWSRDPGTYSTWYQGGLFRGPRAPWVSEKNALFTVAGAGKDNWVAGESVDPGRLLRSLQLRNPVIVSTVVGLKVRDANGTWTGQVSSGLLTFAVLGMYQQDGQWMVTVMNPRNSPDAELLVQGAWRAWGATFTITWADLRAYFDDWFWNGGADPIP